MHHQHQAGDGGGSAEVVGFLCPQVRLLLQRCLQVLKGGWESLSEP